MEADDVEEIDMDGPLENQDLSFLHDLNVGEFVAAYGWYLMFVTVLVYLLIQHLSKKWANHSSSSEPVEDGLTVSRKQEAMEASRRRMQEDLDAKAALFRERQAELEEEKRRQKIEMWDSMKEGKSYRGTVKVSQGTEEASSSSTGQKPKTEKKPLRSSGYNPLSGEGGSCAWRPGRRGPSAGGG